jgi:ubiquitin-protein ligase
MSDSLVLPGALQILADYEELRPMLCFGLYVIPDTIDLYIWHGLIVLRDGRYKGGKFRFILLVHPLYPADGARPVVVFLDKPYHPLVDSTSGILQLEMQFPKWVAGVDRLAPVVEYVRTVLTSDLVMDPKRSLAYNMEALSRYATTPRPT